MKIVAIQGSPHGMKGNTGRMLERLIASATDAGAEVTTFLLGEMNVRPCRACDVCHRVGTCPQPDDFATIYNAMRAADGIVLASPNYIFSVTAQMKCLMDRCCGPLHVQSLADKHAAAVVTSGGQESAPVEQYMLRFLRALGCWTVGSVGAEAWKLADNFAKVEALAPAAELGGRLAEAIKSRQTFPEQEAERSAFRDRMREIVMMRKDEWAFEYEHWQAMP